jgi:hypothetical protein
MGDLLAVPVILALCFAFACEIIARNRGVPRSGAWFFYGLLFGVFALIVLLTKPAQPTQR